MSTVIKHKKTGNQSVDTDVFNLESAIKEVGLQLGNYATAQQLIDNTNDEKKKAKDMLDKLLKQFKKQGVKLGDLPRKGSENAYIGVEIKQDSVRHTVEIYQSMPTSLSHDTRKNYISAFRTCMDRDIAFSNNPSRDRTKGAKDSAKELAKDKDVAEKAPKTPDQKHGEVKHSLADVIKANFKTLLGNNPQRAAELVDELAEMLDM